MKGTSSVKTFKLLLGDTCSLMLKPLAWHCAIVKTSEGKVMFISTTSGAKCPSTSLNTCCFGTVSVGMREEEFSELALYTNNHNMISGMVRLAVKNLKIQWQQRRRDGKQDFVSCVFSIFSPEQFQHGFDCIGEEIPISLDMALFIILKPRICHYNYS